MASDEQFQQDSEPLSVSTTSASSDPKHTSSADPMMSPPTVKATIRASVKLPPPPPQPCRPTRRPHLMSQHQEEEQVLFQEFPWSTSTASPLLPLLPKGGYDKENSTAINLRPRLLVLLSEGQDWDPFSS